MREARACPDAGAPLRLLVLCCNQFWRRHRVISRQLVAPPVMNQHQATQIIQQNVLE
jgi:hypothetical protein